jgi:hypothetical protein
LQISTPAQQLRIFIRELLRTVLGPSNFWAEACHQCTRGCPASNSLFKILSYNMFHSFTLLHLSERM